MKRQIKLTVLLTLGLFILGIFSSSVLADQKSEEKPAKAKTMERATALDEMAEILSHYFAIRDLLAHDQTDKVAQQAKQMSERLDKLIKGLQEIRTASGSLKAKDLKQAREGFSPLSKAVLNYVKEFGFSGEAYCFYCGMVKKSWLQEHDRIGNPYYGSKMYKCGEMTGMMMNGKLVPKAQGKSEIRTYEVFGMNCPGCHGAVEKLVKKIPTVEQAEANWEEKRLVVTMRPGAQLNDEDIYDAIRRANFTPGKRIE